ncbi:MAG: galactose-1-phosphate uridylyltransferase [Candidatus Woesearchaeota archaeon]
MELRKDYILDRYVIISEIRGLRPNFYKKEFINEQLVDDKTPCVFCPGHEYLAPREKGRIGDPWMMRWFDNKYPAVEPLGKQYIQTDNKYFTFSDAYGYHEVIVESNDHDKQLHDFDDSELRDLFILYKNRILELSNKDNIKYVLVFKNYGPEAGTSVKHTHSQVIAFNHVPKLIRDELTAVSNNLMCPYCEILAIERKSYRTCFENDSFVAFTPYASRFNYEIWIFPKRHYVSITQLSDSEMHELAVIMKCVLSKLKILNCSYNYYIHDCPKDFVTHPKNLHFHIEITPRIDTLGAVELGAETYINRVSPETAAKFYRGEIHP